MNAIVQCLKRSRFVYWAYNLRNGFWKHGLQVEMKGKDVLINGIRVRQSGKDNLLCIEAGARICQCTFQISGDHNRIYIGAGASLRGTHFHMEDDGNEIHIGAGTTTTDQVHISAIEGTKVCIGEDCMISAEIYMSTGDGHTVCDRCGNRTNPSRDIVLGDHVWIGTKTVIGKNFRIGSHSILAAGSVCVASGEAEDNVVMGGNPAKVVKRDVDWLRERIPTEERHEG
nr:hypothetical protein [uncultured Acetatifactor sp.]